MEKLFLATLCIFLPIFSCVIGCPSAFYWIEAGESCYRVSTEAKTWYEARLFCTQEGGYLVELKSDEETAIVNELFRNDWWFWTGLTDNVRDGEWVWDESETPMEYSNWLENQPDNVGEDHCVLLCGADFEWCNEDCN